MKKKIKIAYNGCDSNGVDDDDDALLLYIFIYMVFLCVEMCKKKSEIKTSIKKFNSCKMEKLGELLYFPMRISNVFSFLPFCFFIHN